MRTLFTILFFLNIVTALSQEDTVRVTNLFKITAIHPGLAFEARLAARQTLYVQAYAATTFGLGFSLYDGTLAYLVLDPAMNVQYRFYYNGTKRSKRGRNTSNNSMNYLALSVDCVFSRVSIYQEFGDYPNRRPVFQQAFLIGMQRSYRKRFNLDLSVGTGFYVTKTRQQDFNDRLYEKTSTGFMLDMHLTLGWWLNGRKD